MIFIFGGTTEGHELVRFFEDLKKRIKYFVATEYGEEILGNTEFVEVIRGRKNTDEITAMIKSENASLVIDATHPFATKISENLRKSCELTATKYLRIVRETQTLEKVESKGVLDKAKKEQAKKIRYFRTLKSVVEYLKTTTGNILLTTGSKQIHDFIELDSNRIYARVLPDEESIRACVNAGINKSHIIAMQGPFSPKMNEMMLEQYSCKFLVTKEAGATGGFSEKIIAAKQVNAEVLVLERPSMEEGMSVEEFRVKWNDVTEDENEKEILHSDDLKQVQKMESENLPAMNKNEGNGYRSDISIIGIGPGHEKYLTKIAEEKIKRADAICGATRMITFARKINPSFREYTNHDALSIMQWVLERVQENDTNIVILMSGDTGFYSGAKRVFEVFSQTSGFHVEIYPGISSVSIMASVTGIPWDRYSILSLHGKESENAGMFCYTEFIQSVFEQEYSFAITDGLEKNEKIIQELVDSGLGEVRVYIGEELGYENQKITEGMAMDLLSHKFSKLCVLLVHNPNPQMKLHKIGIKDAEFLRGKVPMTKEEIRTLSLSKLEIGSGDICFDIGAGTGSVSIEMSRLARVTYAIEMKEEGILLIKENAIQFGISYTMMTDILTKYRLNIIHARAMTVLDKLPAPDCVFIGGSSGEMKGILKSCFTLNKYARVVINAVSMETMAELHDIAKEYENLGYEANIISVNISRAEQIGKYHIMNALNPVMILSLRYVNEKKD